MAASASYIVRSPQWILSYLGVNITADVSQMVLAIRYIDRLDGASGELEVELEDSAKRWQGPWYPTLGDIVSLQIGYSGEALLDCGEFQIDELELDGPPDVMRLRCLAAYITPAMRTANTVAYENMGILEIVAQIATKDGLTMVVASSESEGDLRFARVTQRRQTDLEFLKRLAREHNFDFTVRAGQLVFYERDALESIPATAAITRSDTVRFSFRNRARRIYDGAEFSYFDPDTKQLITQSVPADLTSPTGDTLKLVARCENAQQALVKADAGLHLHNMVFVDASLEGPGNPLQVAGNNVQLIGWGALDGTYLIETAQHHLARATGYSTSIAARRVSA
ncbi:MAG: phage late control D family protein [Candidatus Binatus sp.]